MGGHLGKYGDDTVQGPRHDDRQAVSADRPKVVRFHVGIVDDDAVVDGFDDGTGRCDFVAIDALQISQLGVI